MIDTLMIFIFGAVLGYGAACVAVAIEDYKEYKKIR